MAVGLIKELELPVVMIDGIHFRDRVILVDLGIDSRGDKHVLGLREGSTGAGRVVRSLLSDLVDRGLDADRARLWVIDGGKALRKAIVECFGALALIQRCQEHKRRNVIEHLPQELHASAGRALRDAWDGGNAELAKKQLQRLAASLHAKHFAHHQPVRELERLDCSLHAQRQALDGQITLRWIAGALSDAKGRFRKLRGYRDMKTLLAALKAKSASITDAERKAA